MELVTHSREKLGKIQKKYLGLPICHKPYSIWILSNRKSPERKGKVLLINATDFGQSMRKSLGSKRKELTKESIKEIVKLYGKCQNSKVCKVFDNSDFGYRRITIERPLQLSFYPHDKERLEALKSDKAFVKLGELGDEILEALSKMERQIDDRELFVKALGIKLTASQLKLLQKHIGEQNEEEATLCYDKKGNVEPNPDLRDYENVPLKEDIYEYFEREVKPHVPLAWIDETKRDAKDGEVGIVGYEIPFNRHFYEYVPPRPLEEIDAELETLSREIVELLNEI